MDDIEFMKFSPEINDRLERFENLELLSLNNCGLATLKNFPKCSQLTNLEIGENSFPATDLVHLAGLTQLEHLVMHECEINSA